MDVVRIHPHFLVGDIEDEDTGLGRVSRFFPFPTLLCPVLKSVYQCFPVPDHRIKETLSAKAAIERRCYLPLFGKGSGMTLSVSAT